jgi:putative SOS response-associated peptidase YedK
VDRHLHIDGIDCVDCGLHGEIAVCATTVMCGRAAVVRDGDQLQQITGARRFINRQAYRGPAYNLSPGAHAAVLTKYNREQHEEIEHQDDKAMDLITMKWGLIPSYTKDIKTVNAYSMFNARSETVDSKSTFKRLINRNRCVLPIDGYAMLF